MNSQTIRVIIADDHAGVRTGIKSLLAKAGDIEVIAEAADGAEATNMVDIYRPDVLLLDVELPIKRGEEVARDIKQQGWDVKILAISSYNDKQYARGMLENGAAGYITKDEAPTMLIEAIRGVAQGQKGWVSKRVAEDTGPLLPTRLTLSQREMQVLSLLASELSEDEIIQTLAIPASTFQDYLQLLLEKFSAETKRELLKIARREELV